MLQILDTGMAVAQENMAQDGRFLETLDPKGRPILHFYQWDGPSATYGYFSDPSQHLALEMTEALHLRLARRPTGGGIVFHIWDLAFSFLMPAGHLAFSLNTLDNYRFVNNIVLEVVAEKFGFEENAELISENMHSGSFECRNFCMAMPTQYDVVYKGRKIAGAAQRRTKKGYLHQGTISLASPHLGFLRSVLRSKEEVFRAMSHFTFAPLGACWNPIALKSARLDLQERLIQKFQEKLLMEKF